MDRLTALTKYIEYMKEETLIEYLNYIEKNLYNGILAQAYWKEDLPNGQISSYPSEGLLTYFLPMRAGSRKGWASKTQDFFCCHGSVVQANAAHNQYLYYQDGATPLHAFQLATQMLL